MADLVDRKRFGTAANVRAALVVFAVALLLMAVFLSASLQGYAYDLPEGPVSERLVAAAEQWHLWMEEIGAAGIADSVTGEIQSLHDSGFDQ
jgi:hypothetical protein